MSESEPGAAESTVESKPEGDVESKPEGVDVASLVDLAETAAARSVEAIEVADQWAERAEAAAIRAEAAAIECASLLAAFGSGKVVQSEPGTEEEERGTAGFLEEESPVEEEGESPVEEEEEPASRPVKVCKACHATTTQLAANQCPMCGNPFLP